MKYTLVCGNCLSPTLVVNEKCDSHPSLDQARRFIKTNQRQNIISRTFYTKLKISSTELKTPTRKFFYVVATCQSDPPSY